MALRMLSVNKATNGASSSRVPARTVSSRVRNS